MLPIITDVKPIDKPLPTEVKACVIAILLS